jgi:hypothetical protein
VIALGEMRFDEPGLQKVAFRRESPSFLEDLPRLFEFRFGEERGGVLGERRHLGGALPLEPLSFRPRRGVGLDRFLEPRALRLGLMVRLVQDENLSILLEGE